MSRPRRDTDDPAGYDSFLDIVANLVGILVILIIVIGAQAADAMIEKKPGGEEKIDVASPKQAAASLESDINQLAARISRQEFEIAYRRNERDRMLYAVTFLEQELADGQKDLDQKQRDRLDRLRQVADAERELQRIRQETQAVKHAKPPTKVLPHLPTPMAKTVFGKEVHFRLGKGRLAYIPWDDLVERLKKEAPEKAWKLKDSTELTETIGPLDDFWLNYTLTQATLRVPTRSGYAVQQGMRLDHFTIDPVRDDVGDPVDVALKPHSRFHARLEMYDPDRTTVTVWVYPDSFSEFRAVKEELFKIGFLCAGRPLPAGYPIGAAPEGTRSVAQ